MLSGLPELEEKLSLPQFSATPAARHDSVQNGSFDGGADPRLHSRKTRNCGSSSRTGAYLQSGGHGYSAPLFFAVLRVVNLLCEHAPINAYVEQQRPMQLKILEDVAREFQLDVVEPTASPESLRTSAEL